jgi:LPXTG-site transpeptidase (sortase) family protein
LILLFSGVTLLCIYGSTRVHAVLGRAYALEAFAVARTQAETEASLPGDGGGDALPSHTAKVDMDPPDQSLWGSQRIAAYRDSLRTVGVPPAGVLTIPAIDLRVPIFEGTADVTLNRGVGHIEETADLSAGGNVGIAGHRDGFFRGLKDVEVGDEVHVQSLEGATRYRVSELLIVEPTDIYVLDATDHATVTLVTCYPFYFLGEAPQRFIVKAVAIP